MFGSLKGKDVHGPTVEPVPDCWTGQHFVGVPFSQVLAVIAGGAANTVDAPNAVRVERSFMLNVKLVFIQLFLIVDGE